MIESNHLPTFINNSSSFEKVHRSLPEKTKLADVVTKKFSELNLPQELIENLPLQTLEKIEAQLISDQFLPLEFKSLELKSSSKVCLKVLPVKKTADLLVSAKIYRLILSQKMALDPNNMELILQYAKESIKLAEGFEEVAETVEKVPFYSQQKDVIREEISNLSSKAKIINPLHPYPYLIISLVSASMGISSSNVSSLKSLVKALVVARTLDPTSKEISSIQRAAVKQIKECWNELNIQENKTNAKKFEQWNKDLDALVDGEFLPEFFKATFLKYKNLFGRAPEHLYEEFPHLERQIDFLKKYPELKGNFENKKESELLPVAKPPVSAPPASWPFSKLENLSDDFKDLKKIEQALQRLKGTEYTANIVASSYKPVMSERLASILVHGLKDNRNLSILVANKEELEVLRKACEVVFKNTVHPDIIVQKMTIKTDQVTHPGFLVRQAKGL